MLTGALVAIALFVIPPSWSWLGSPTIVVRNDTGKSIDNVRLTFLNPDYHHVEERARVAPGEEIEFTGGGTHYELSLIKVRFDLDGQAKTLGYGELPDAFAPPWSEFSLYSIDPQGRLRTITQSEWGADPVTCSCPVGNADGDGSANCEIRRHKTHWLLTQEIGSSTATVDSATDGEEPAVSGSLWEEPHLETRGSALRAWAASKRLERERRPGQVLDPDSALQGELTDLGWPGVKYLYPSEYGLALFFTDVGALGHDRGVFVAYPGVDLDPSQPPAASGAERLSATRVEGVYRAWSY